MHGALEIVTKLTNMDTFCTGTGCILFMVLKWTRAHVVSAFRLQYHEEGLEHWMLKDGITRHTKVYEQKDDKRVPERKREMLLVISIIFFW